MSTDDAASPSSEPPFTIGQLNYQSACLLIVEDQDDLWTLIEIALAKQLPEVEICRTNGRQQTVAFLIERLDNQLPLPKLILQDLYIPHQQAGISLIKDIRMMMASYQYVPVIVMSSSNDLVDIREVYQANASYYVVKPANFQGWLTLFQSLRSFWWEQGVLPTDQTVK